MKLTNSYFAVFIFFLHACSYYNPVNYTTTTTKINDTDSVDSSIIQMIDPYKNKISAEISEVVGYTETDMKKGKPESTLGNFVADALLHEGKLINKNIDFVVHNYGGLRIDNIPAGEITRGKLFELLPFDNFAVIVVLDGQTTAQLIHKIVEEGGWPVAGISLTMQNGEALNIRINDMPFDTAKQYHVLMNDYMANGGDKMDFLKGSEIILLGKTIRDVIIEYIQKENSFGRKINSTLDRRINYAE